MSARWSSLKPVRDPFRSQESGYSKGKEERTRRKRIRRNSALGKAWMRPTRAKLWRMYNAGYANMEWEQCVTAVGLNVMAAQVVDERHLRPWNLAFTLGSSDAFCDGIGQEDVEPKPAEEREKLSRKKFYRLSWVRCWP